LGAGDEVPVAVPHLRSLHRPPQDSRQLGDERTAETIVALDFGNGDSKRHESNSSPDRLTDAANDRLVLGRLACQRLRRLD